MLTSGVVLLHDNGRPHTPVRTRTLQKHFSWELFDHAPYIPDLAPRDYQLFTYLNNWLRSQCFNNEEFIEGVKKWLSSQAGDIFDTGVQKRALPYDKSLNSGSDCVKKLLKYVRIFYT
jgi:hypothetical protein